MQTATTSPPQKAHNQIQKQSSRISENGEQSMRKQHPRGKFVSVIIQLIKLFPHSFDGRIFSLLTQVSLINTALERRTHSSPPRQLMHHDTDEIK